MAVATKNMDPCDARWRRRLVLRVMAVVVALVAVSCVAWVTDYLRQWTSEHSGEVHRPLQVDMFILPSLLFTVRAFFTLSLPSNNEPVMLVVCMPSPNCYSSFYPPFHHTHPQGNSPSATPKSWNYPI